VKFRLNESVDCFFIQRRQDASYSPLILSMFSFWNETRPLANLQIFWTFLCLVIGIIFPWCTQKNFFWITARKLLLLAVITETPSSGVWNRHFRSNVWSITFIIAPENGRKIFVKFSTRRMLSLMYTESLAGGHCWNSLFGTWCLSSWLNSYCYRLMWFQKLFLPNQCCVQCCIGGIFLLTREVYERILL